MLDLGIVKSTMIKPVFISPSGDPRAYEFRGSLIAIRKRDAKFIEIIQ
jgi:ferrous iron transport protein A